MIHTYEGGHSLSSIAREPGFAVPTVGITVKDAACVKEHVKGKAMMKLMMTKKR
jgi:hypothetical protein